MNAMREYYKKERN